MFDQYSKIFTLKVQFVSYKERAGIRPGQISKLEKLTGKIGFLAKAVEDADYKGVKEFASDMKKLGMPLEHAAQVGSKEYRLLHGKKSLIGTESPVHGYRHPEAAAHG